MYMLRCSVYGRIKPDTAGVNLFKHWTNTTLHHDYIYQKDNYHELRDREDIVSDEWVKHIMSNYCTVELIQMVEEKYQTLEDIQQGGITHNNISLNEIFCMKKYVVTSLHDFLKALSKDDITKHQGDNVSVSTTQINVMCECLYEANNLPRETTVYIFTSITRCNVPDFIGHFDFFPNTENLKQMNTDVFMNNTSKVTLARSKEITLTAYSYFHLLNMFNGWNVPSGHQIVSC